jgi:NADH:ubiquinone reductase (H+-translocating)
LRGRNDESASQPAGEPRLVRMKNEEPVAPRAAVSPVIVVGTGYAGILSALRVARKAHAPVLLLGEAPVLVERIRIHERLARERPICHRLAPLLAGTHVRYEPGRVIGADFTARTVTTAEGATFGYARLILAPGSVATHPAHGLSLARADELRRELPTVRRVLVVGGGLTGIEAGCEIAEAFPHVEVTLLTDRLASELGSAGRDYVRATLRRLGVVLREGERLVSVDDGRAITSEGDILFDRCIDTTGMRASPLLGDLGLEVDARGQARVDPLLRAQGHRDVYVVGDAATPGEGWSAEAARHVGMGCKSAMPMGAHAADNVASSLLGRPQAPFAYRHPGYCLSLGRRVGLIQTVDAEGAPTPRVLRGRLGAWVKELVCRYTVFSLRLERAGLDYRWRKLPAALPAAGAYNRLEA